uniref:Uncharacterized protein n=1 Tax=Globisporangium ultimum (strain ATCC 200006 / CBS 805.95 / DAOM BR144) TaxID=431595 RepID=K3W7S6_GLOUD
YKHDDDDDDVSPSPSNRDQSQTSPLQSQAPRFETPSLLQTAFLQHHSPPPQPKAFGLASSGVKKKSDSNDVLKSMASSPTKLSQKLMRGGKMDDYSEFEEEDEVDLQSLIGSKSSMTVGSGSSALKAFSSSASASAASSRAHVKVDNDFDVDF